MRAIARLAVAGLLLTGVAGCASATSSHAGAPPSATSGIAASCALSPAQAIRRAPVEFIAIALAGRSASGASASGGDALISPARMQVLRWLKGHGPPVVAVQTGIGGSGRVSEDGIAPHHGERWRIVSMSRRRPYPTSACLGSTRLPSLVMHPGAPG